MTDQRESTGEVALAREELTALDPLMAQTARGVLSQVAADPSSRVATLEIFAEEPPDGELLYRLDVLVRRSRDGERLKSDDASTRVDDPRFVPNFDARTFLLEGYRATVRGGATNPYGIESEDALLRAQAYAWEDGAKAATIDMSTRFDEAATLVAEVERINGFRFSLSTIVGAGPHATELSFVCASPKTDGFRGGGLSPHATELTFDHTSPKINGHWVALHWSSSSGYLVQAELRISLSEVVKLDDEKLKQHIVELVKEACDLDMRDPQFRDGLTRIGKPPRPRAPRRPFPGRPPASEASTRVDKAKR